MIRYKIDDTLPALIAQLQCEEGFDLTSGQTVSFVLYKPDSSIVMRACTVVDTAANVVQFDWIAGDLDQAGTYAGEFIVGSGGLQRTFPPDNYVNIRVSERPA